MIDIPLIIIGAIVGTLGGIIMGWRQSKSFVNADGKQNRGGKS